MSPPVPSVGTSICIQQLQELALSQTQGTGSARLDGGACRRPTARGVFPRGVHAAGRDCPHRLLEQTGRAIYGLLFRASAETVMTIAADPKRLSVRVGTTSVLHTWGSAMTYHPHIHMIVPGGGLSLDGTRWIGCKPGFFLHARVLLCLFRRLFLEGLVNLHRAGRLTFFNGLAGLADADAFTAYLTPLRKTEWVDYAKPPFGGPEAVLAYLSRYTHRVAISNSRLVSANANSVSFRWNDYRIKSWDRMKVMRLDTHEFIRRFLSLHPQHHRVHHRQKSQPKRPFPIGDARPPRLLP